MTWKATDPTGLESAKIKWEIVRYTRGRGLDIGCGVQKTFPHFIGVDNGKDTVLFGAPIHPDVWIKDAADLSLFASQSCDFVFSSHLLEHIEPERVGKVLKEWWRVIKPGGHLVMYLPDEDEYPKIGEPGANPDHRWNINQAKVLEYMDSFSWDLVDYQKRNQEREYSLFFVFRKLASRREHMMSYQKELPKKRCAVVRYGAFGDLLQASSVFAGLKKQGWHVTLFTSPPGDQVVHEDPNIDEFYLQDKDQVPNHELADFWSWHQKKYDRWINLSESVEGSLLALPGRIQHAWSPRFRHAQMDKNYLEFQHGIAGVAHDPQVRFYATAQENKWCAHQRFLLKGRVVLWPLAGSSVHKTWPYMDTLIARALLTFPDIHFVLVGNEDCKILERGWEKEPRVWCRSGVWSIRKTLAFVEHCDLLIGPETGVMNAGAQLPIPKLVFLSHSTVENLTRDWMNTHAFQSEHTICPGRGNNEAPACHQLHYGWSHCRRTENGVAQCQEDISVESVWQTMKALLAIQADEAA